MQARNYAWNITHQMKTLKPLFTTDILGLKVNGVQRRLGYTHTQLKRKSLLIVQERPSCVYLLSFRPPLFACLFFPLEIMSLSCRNEFNQLLFRPGSWKLLRELKVCWQVMPCNQHLSFLFYYISNRRMRLGHKSFKLCIEPRPYTKKAPPYLLPGCLHFLFFLDLFLFFAVYATVNTCVYMYTSTWTHLVLFITHRVMMYVLTDHLLFSAYHAQSCCWSVCTCLTF